MQNSLFIQTGPLSGPLAAGRGFGRVSSRAGVGLLEVIIALFIFATCITGMCSAIVMLRQANDRSRDHYVAINLAKNRLERARSFGYDQLPLFVETQTLVDRSGTATQTGDFRRSTVVSNVTLTLREVRVTVEIRNRDTWTFVPGMQDIRSFVADVKTPESEI